MKLATSHPDGTEFDIKSVAMSSIPFYRTWFGAQIPELWESARLDFLVMESEMGRGAKRLEVGLPERYAKRVCENCI